MKFLIVDNDAGIRRLMASVLAPLAPEIVECADGADALAAYEAHHPDVVLMDIAMQRLDGIAATAAITAVHPAARVLIVTNYDDTDLREAASVAGACGYVLKENLLQIPPLLERLTR
jgi:DNA-binding NarL/FixJ family response regulator